MRTRVMGSGWLLVGTVILAGATACSSSNQGTPAASGGQAGNTSAGQGGNGSAQGGNGSAQGGNSSARGGNTSAQGGSDGGCNPNAANGSYVLIDDMETTDHGPIEFTAGINAPLSPGYWYNSGANYAPSGGGGGGVGGANVIDTSTPPQGSFAFSALPKATTTLNCKASAHAAHQYCVLNGQYDTCGVGFEFAQQPDTSAGGAAAGSGGSSAGGSSAAGSSAGGSSAGAAAGGAAAGGTTGGTGAGGAAAGGGTGAGGTTAGSTGAGGSAAGASGSSAGGSSAGGSSAGTAGASAGTAGASAGAGGGASIPMVTVPFDISHYKAVTFWGMTTTPDATKGSLRVKIQFPDTDTDPRGKVCNGGGSNNSRCYNSYAAYFEFTTSWQQFTVLLDAGTGGVPPTGGIAIDPSWGYQQAKWLPDQVYGISWQAQKDTLPDAGPPLMTDIWIDDVYFVE